MMTSISSLPNECPKLSRLFQIFLKFFFFFKKVSKFSVKSRLFIMLKTLSVKRLLTFFNN